MAKKLQLPYGIGATGLGNLVIRYINLRLKIDHHVDFIMHTKLPELEVYSKRHNGYLYIEYASTTDVSYYQRKVGKALHDIQLLRLGDRFEWTQERTEEPYPYAEADL